MKKFKKPLKIIMITAAGLVLINAAAMSLLFGINIFDPLHGSSKDVSRFSAKADSSAAGTISDRGSTESSGYSQVNGADDALASSDSQAVTEGIEGTTDQQGTPSGKQAAALSDNKTTGDQVAITKDEVASLYDLSFEDKITVLSMLSKLSTKTNDKIYDMIIDGVTQGEIAKIEALLSESLSQKEIDTLYELLEKNRIMFAER